MIFFKLWLAYTSFGVSVLIFMWGFDTIKMSRKYKKLKKDQKDQKDQKYKKDQKENKEQGDLKPLKIREFDMWTATTFSLAVSFFPALFHYMVKIL